MKQKYVIALYIRLSVEDFKTESLSIPNQKLLLRGKAMSLQEWDNSEVLEFVDNGHTGTNFERPAVQELLTMVQVGKIDCIIVKDLSRFGRNSIETGYFIEPNTQRCAGANTKASFVLMATARAQTGAWSRTRTWRGLSGRYLNGRLTAIQPQRSRGNCTP